MAEKDLSDIPYLLIGSGVALKEELERLAEQLVEKGKSLTPEGRREKAKEKKGFASKGGELTDMMVKAVDRVLENAGIPSREDLEAIERRISNIENKIKSK